MLPAEQAIVSTHLGGKSSWRCYNETQKILQAVRNLNKNVSNAFFKEIVHYHRNNTFWSKHLLVDIFLITDKPDKTDLEPILEVIGELNPNTSLFTRKEWIDYPFSENDLSRYINQSDNFTKAKIFINMIKNFKQPVDIMKINANIRKDKSSFIINALFYAKKYKLLGPVDDPLVIYAQLINKTFIDDVKAVSEALAQKNYKGITYMFDTFEQKPRSQHFISLITAPWNYRKRHFISNGQQVTEILDLMFNNGFIPTINEILEATTNGFHINNVDRFLAAPDDKQRLIKKCYDVYYFKYVDILGISKETAEMYEYCTAQTSQLSGVKRLIKQGYIPDKLALKYACENSHQKKVIEFLMQHVKPDVDCFKAFCKTCDKTGILSKMDDMTNKRLNRTYNN